MTDKPIRQNKGQKYKQFESNAHENIFKKMKM